MLCFSMIPVSGQSKSRPVKAAGAESCGQRRNQKLHAAVAKNTFGSENAKKLTVSEHFLKFRCQKIARRCGETHIWKWKCTKHVSFGALFEALMSQNCTPLWRNAHLEAKMYKTRQFRSTFLKFWCRKIARCCGETHIWKWKCTKHVSFGTLFEVLMSKNCTPLWRKAHLEVKMYKTRQFRSTFWSSDVEKLHDAVAKSTFGSENVQNTSVSDSFLKF